VKCGSYPYRTDLARTESGGRFFRPVAEHPPDPENRQEFYLKIPLPPHALVSLSCCLNHCILQDFPVRKKCLLGQQKSGQLVKKVLHGWNNKALCARSAGSNQRPAARHSHNRRNDVQE